MSNALEGMHYCEDHQGNHSHYDQKNCEVCKLRAQVEILGQRHFWPEESERVREGLEPQDGCIYRQMPEEMAYHHYTALHGDHMTRENLYGKWEIAGELGWRDAQIKAMSDVTVEMKIAGMQAWDEAMRNGVSGWMDMLEVVYEAMRNKALGDFREALEDADA
jgi:hypothetical protein